MLTEENLRKLLDQSERANVMIKVLQEQRNNANNMAAHFQVEANVLKGQLDTERAKLVAANKEIDALKVKLLASTQALQQNSNQA